MDINRREICRYLGYGKEKPDPRTEKLMEECITELCRVISPRSMTRRFPLAFHSEKKLDFGCFQVESADLAKNLRGCEEVLLFAASLGIGPDFLLQRYSRLEMSRAVMLQAVSAAMIEAYCDEVNDELERKANECGQYLRPRFSPGYGDFSLTHQSDLCRILSAEKTVGITLTDSLLMLPSKSVTAVIGVGRTQPREQNRPSGKCEVCEHFDCLYRRS